MLFLFLDRRDGELQSYRMYEDVEIIWCKMAWMERPFYRALPACTSSIFLTFFVLLLV